MAYRHGEQALSVPKGWITLLWTYSCSFTKHNTHSGNTADSGLSSVSPKLCRGWPCEEGLHNAVFLSRNPLAIRMYVPFTFEMEAMRHMYEIRTYNECCFLYPAKWQTIWTVKLPLVCNVHTCYIVFHIWRNPNSYAHQIVNFLLGVK